ncbi:MAG: electron transfer flavoprotein subunit beta/FixA family protein [Deltaproteobacteria bacterium]|nr:electron transfer flavoprotein subunit beta/FixA family protein [Deltaproteobacteria bacterium]
MDIIVLIKQVPDTTEVKLDPKTGTLIREGVESIINPDDLHALESAISIKETLGGRITVLSMGPAQAIDAISEAIGMGADEGILLTDKAFAGADTWATSYTLGKAIEKLGSYDLVLCGRQAIDGDTAQIGPQVADFLGVPQVTYVFGIEEIEKGKVVVKRRLEDGFEVVECPLPGLLTMTNEMNTPRYPLVGRLIDSCKEKAPIKVWNAADIGVKTSEVGLEGSLTHVIRTFSPKQKREGEIIKGDTKEAVETLLDKIREKKLL